MRRWFRFLTLVACLLALVVLAGCSRKVQVPRMPAEPKYEFSATPEQAVEGFIRDVNAGEYGRAARYYFTAPEMWHSDPAMWKSVIEGSTKGRHIVRYEPFSETRKVEVVSIAGWISFEGGGTRQGDFELVRRPEGWIIVKFY